MDFFFFKEQFTWVFFSLIQNYLKKLLITSLYILNIFYISLGFPILENYKSETASIIWNWRNSIFSILGANMQVRCKIHKQKSDFRSL